MRSALKIVILGYLCIALLSCAGQPVSDDGGDFADDGAVAQPSDTGDGADSGAGSGDLLADGGSESSSSSGGDDFDSVDQDLEKEQKIVGSDESLGEELQDDLAPMDKQSDSGTKDAEVAQSPTKEESFNDPQVEIESTPKSAKEESSLSVSELSDDPLQDLAKNDGSSTVTEPIVEDASQSKSNQVSSKGSGRAEISNIKFEGNESGGALIIEGNQPLDYTTRMNAESNQFVVEISGAQLPKRLKRPFITKDFPSSIGSIDAYQTPNGDTVRVVVQLREGASEPAAHSEGSSVIIVPQAILADNSVKAPDAPSTSEFQTGTGTSANILSSKNLETFLSGNMRYFGKKISIEMKDIEVRDAINLIAEESGANIIMSEGVSGNLAIKLKNVPWDQALVLILKAKKLGYTRQGNVLRISPLSEIKQEEEDALKIVESRRKVEVLKVQMIPINYAKISDLQAQIKTVISERGSLVADNRTNSLIITETEEVLERARKIISSLDIAPAQVLIEGKLVEARESFNKRLGIQWEVTGTPMSLGDGPNGPINMVPNLAIRPGALSGGSLGFNLSLGTLDILGDLNAVLSLEEQEENVRVISSPRIVTLHNEAANISQMATVAVLASENKKDGSKTYKDLPLKMELKVKPEVANNGVVQLEVDIMREFLGAVRSDGSAGSHSRSAKTKVMVKSGQTAVIGGIYQNDSSQLDTGVPFLKDLPIFGFFFRSGNFHKDKTELLLFLTPRVLSQAGGSIFAQDKPIQSDSMNSNEGDLKLE
ncbi:MAG: hypothetical protein RJB66_564 [Pseudomonadota bacterium]|jgi:type IV pilus assembly protein PilQ